MPSSDSPVAAPQPARLRRFVDPVASSGRTVSRMAALGPASLLVWARTLERTRGGAEKLHSDARALQELAEAVCERHGLDVTTRGPAPPRGVVLVSNHVSYVDTFLLPSLSPSTCVAKREIAQWPIVGPLATRLGILFVDRASAHSGAFVLRRAMRALQAGITVIGFPEGTTSPGDRLLPFKRGLFGLARLMNVPVVPTAIAYDGPAMAWFGDDSFLAHYARTLARRSRTQVTLTFGAPLEPRAFATAEALSDAARRCIASGLSL